MNPKYLAKRQLIGETVTFVELIAGMILTSDVLTTSSQDKLRLLYYILINTCGR
jgi:hypothetical protein